MSAYAILVVFAPIVRWTQPTIGIVNPRLYRGQKHFVRGHLADALHEPAMRFGVPMRPRLDAAPESERFF